ncbi:hypothetical protein [Vibrio parahaemolyticus]|uniref:hypothetical protein n=2 Tax=Vibrionaceae TaxID=641 RepID=UPI00209C4469|nr:hypothetical protein [Vibrio parahaemolyticus]MCR9766750.1 hypothetical protein [Vibrio parahaemolyticus]MCX4129176.1 hypothetical protein [Vibrio parahaemolyticus]
MLLKKRRTVVQIAASIRSRNNIDDFPSLERLKLYEQWKPGTAKKVLDGIWLYQEKRTKIELQEVEQAIADTYKRQLVSFGVKLAAIFAVNAAIYVIQIILRNETGLYFSLEIQPNILNRLILAIPDSIFCLADEFAL